MTTNLSELTLWISALRENENLEFKEARNQYDNTKLFRHCVALANEGGGKLILGVTDVPPRRVVGTSAFHTPVGIQSKIFDKLRFRVEVEEFSHPDGRVVIFHVPSRPRGTAYHLEGAYFMRSTDGTVPMTEDRLRQIFDEGKPDWLTRIARNDCSASDVIRLLDTQSYFDLLRWPYPANRVSVLDQKMTNASLRDRFKLPESKSETVSRIIADAIQQGKIKPDDPTSTSKRYARYVPYWG